MSFSQCSNCNQLYFPHESHNCNHADSLPSERSALNCNFQIPIQEQGNVQEMSSLSEECHDPREIFRSNIDNVSNAFSREDSVLQDQSTLGTNPANRSDEPAPTLPSFQSTFSNNRLWKVNQEIPLSAPDQTYQISNPGENIPFICGAAADTFILDKSQHNFGEANNCHESFHRSCDIQSAILLNKPSDLSNQEELLEDTRNDKQYNCNKGFTRKRSLKGHKITHTKIAGANVAGHSRTRQDERTCLVCGKEFRDKHDLERHSFVHSGEKRFTCDICKKGFTRNCTLKRHHIKHIRNTSADNVMAILGPPVEEKII